MRSSPNIDAVLEVQRVRVVEQSEDGGGTLVCAAVARSEPFFVDLQGKGEGCVDALAEGVAGVLEVEDC